MGSMSALMETVSFMLPMPMTTQVPALRTDAQACSTVFVRPMASMA